MGLLAAGLVVLIAAVPAAFLVALFSWARWLRRQTSKPPYAPWAAYLLLTLAAVQAVRGLEGAAVAILRIVSRDISLADRQHVLASGIAEAMYGGMLTVVVAAAVALWLLFFTWRSRWSNSPAGKAG